MSIQPKSYENLLKDLIESSLSNTHVGDLSSSSAIDALSKALEVGLYGGHPLHEHGLRRTLSKLGIKSADRLNQLAFGAPLQMESLDTQLKNVTFDMDKLKLWKP